MATPKKESAVAELTTNFSTSTASVLTEYRGLKVSQLTELRKALGNDTTYVVVKNTLSKRAATDAGLDDLVELLQGPTAIAFVGGDPVMAAKGLRDFAKTNPLLVIKGGVLDGKTLTAAEINQIADLETREVLLAKLAGAMKASLTKAAATFQAPISQLARLVQALADKTPAAASEAASTEAAPGAEEPAAEAAPLAEATAE